MEQQKREDGFYWVKYKGTYMVAEYYNREWSSCGNNSGYNEKEFTWISDERIESPEEQFFNAGIKAQPDNAVLDIYHAAKARMDELGYNTFINSKEVNEYRAWLRKHRYAHRLEWFERKFPNGLFTKDAEDENYYGISIVTKLFLAEADAAWEVPKTEAIEFFEYCWEKFVFQVGAVKPTLFYKKGEIPYSTHIAYTLSEIYDEWIKSREPQ